METVTQVIPKGTIFSQLSADSKIEGEVTDILGAFSFLENFGIGTPSPQTSQKDIDPEIKQVMEGVEASLERLETGEFMIGY